MIKFVMCITRHPDMSRENFKDYWMNKHGPFFMENTDAMRAKKYVQSQMLFCIESHRAFSCGLWDLPVYRFGGELEVEGSMSIKRIQSDAAEPRR
jgi:hypothetical protein